MFYPPKKVNAEVSSTKYLNEVDLEITFKVIEPDTFEFLAGQFINLHCNDGTYRSYSIASSPSNTKEISLIVAVAHEGVGSNYLKNLKVGDKIEFIGPSGRFVLPEVLKDTLVFIATGTGVAPIFSMISKLQEESCKSNIHLYFGVRDNHDLFKVDLLNEYASTLSSFDYKLCFSQEIPIEHKENAILGRVTDAFDIANFDKENTQFFMCGNPNMVLQVSQMLIDNGIDQQNVFHEKFTVAQKPASN